MSAWSATTGGPGYEAGASDDDRLAHRVRAAGLLPDCNGMSGPIRLLVLSTLYPSAARPINGIFVETRLRELIKSGAVVAKVIAPVPWFPLRGKMFGRYGTFAATPVRETRNEIDVHHPRYLLPPKIGMNIAPDMLARAIIPVARRLRDDGFDFDLIDAHYYYPDGAAAAIVARAFGKPFVVTARGTDLNVMSAFRVPRRRILETAAAADASIGVSAALMERLAALGADPARLHVLRNGVDLVKFTPHPQEAARRRLGLAQDKRILLAVGHLVRPKGQAIAIQALQSLPADVNHVLAGEGEDRGNLERMARDFGVEVRVRFVGVVAPDELKWYYSAADALVHCSSQEGWANVLLESMACGTPVSTTAIPGTVEVVTAPDAGALMRDRSPDSLVEAFARLFADKPRRLATRTYAERFSWDATTRGQVALFSRILTARALVA